MKNKTNYGGGSYMDYGYGSYGTYGGSYGSGYGYKEYGNSNGNGYGNGYGGSYYPYSTPSYQTYQNYSGGTATNYNPYSVGNYSTTSYARKSYSSGFGYIDTTSYKELLEQKEKDRETVSKIKDYASSVGVLLEFKQSIPSLFKRNGKVTLSIPRSNVDEGLKQGWLQKLIELTNCIEENGDEIDMQIPHAVMNNHHCHTALVSQPASVAYKDIREYIKKNISNKNDKEDFAKKVNSIGGGRTDWIRDYDTVDIKEVNSLAKKLAGKFPFVQKSFFTPSAKKGHRVNRQFIVGNNIDKPLINRQLETKSKKKIVFIIDSSGSMCALTQVSGNKYRTSEAASIFASAVFKSGSFDVTHVIQSGSSGWQDVIHNYRKGNFIHTSGGGGEGFENIYEEVPNEWITSADYVICLTDLEIGTTSQTGLKFLLDKAAHYQVLSFLNSGTIPGLKVKVIKSFEDMVSTLIRLTQS